MCISATTKIRHVILDFDMISQIITFEQKGRFGKEKHQNIDNTLYKNENQKYMLTTEMSDNYDKDALVTSLDKIRANSDNPKWFDGSRAMKVITNLISHKIDAKYIIPTKINMEDGLKMQKI